jgi:RTA1 like protein
VEFIGYCGRASAANKTDHLMPYVIQSTFILLPPALFAATIYMCLGRIIRLVQGDHLSIVRPRILTKVLVTGDVLSFFIQGGSSGLMVMASTKPIMGTIGNAMVITGLAIQLISFAIFTLTALLFHSRIRAAPTARSYEVDPRWVKSMYMLYGISILIIIRSIFRIAEYVMGQDGYLLGHEWTLYIFDTILMFGCSVIFYYFYPDNLVLKPDSSMLLENQISGERVVPKH